MDSPTNAQTPGQAEVARVVDRNIQALLARRQEEDELAKDVAREKLLDRIEENTARQEHRAA